MRKILEAAGYPEKAIEYYLNKTNVKVMENPDSTFTYTGHCGDTITFFLKIENNIIKDASFISTGCSAAHAFGSAVTETVKGKTLEEAKQLTEKDIIDNVGDIPRQKLHCAQISRGSLRGAIETYQNKKQ
jgi:nitrogen fixation protein NifU and related proteins